tara:strand:- start:40 stop:273 length:234 start_codon:yes stop_codon:yes gene_type:complete
VSKKKKEKLPPFEQARENLQKMSDNLNLCTSTMLLVQSIENFETLDKDEQEDMLVLLRATLASLSSFIEKSEGHMWN